MGEARTPKGGLWVIMLVLCSFGGLLLWMIIEKLLDAHHRLANLQQYWSGEIAKAVAEGRTHTERARIAQAAQQAPGGLRLQAAAAQREAALIRKDRECADEPDSNRAFMLREQVQ